MGNTIPQHSHMSHADRPAEPGLAEMIKAREQSIDKRRHEKARIKEQGLFRRIRALGRVWEINHLDDMDYRIIDATMERAGDWLTDDGQEDIDPNDTSADPAPIDQPYDRFKD